MTGAEPRLLRRALLDPILIAATVVGAMIAGGGAAKATEDARRFTLAIVQRQLGDGEPTIRVKQGETVELVWRSDEAAALHLHGYDIEWTVEPGTESVLRFDASTAGRFPVTSHGFSGEHAESHRPLLYIEVHPD